MIAIPINSDLYLDKADKLSIFRCIMKSYYFFKPINSGKFFFKNWCNGKIINKADVICTPIKGIVDKFNFEQIGYTINQRGRCIPNRVSDDFPQSSKK